MSKYYYNGCLENVRIFGSTKDKPVKTDEEGRLDVVGTVNVENILNGININHVEEPIIVQRVIDSVKVSSVIQPVDINSIMNPIEIQNIKEPMEISNILTPVPLNQAYSSENGELFSSAIKITSPYSIIFQISNPRVIDPIDERRIIKIQKIMINIISGISGDVILSKNQLILKLSEYKDVSNMNYDYTDFHFAKLYYGTSSALIENKGFLGAHLQVENQLEFNFNGDIIIPPSNTEERNLTMFINKTGDTEEWIKVWITIMWTEE